MPKRAFTRHNGILRDEYRDDGGRRCLAEVPAALLGETADDLDRSAAWAAAGDPGAVSFHGLVVLPTDPGADVLERLLAGLAVGHQAAAAALLEFVNDARVRPALLAALRAAPPWSVAQVAHAVGIAGGDGAVAALRERRVELAAAAATSADHASFNWTAGSLTAVATALLALDPADTAAAETLVGLATHKCAGNRRAAARHAAIAYEHAWRAGADTDAVRVLATFLRGLVEHADLALLTAAFRAVFVLAPAQALARCEAARGASLRLAVDMAGQIGDGMPAALRADLLGHALEDESPSLRWSAVDQLEALPAAAAAALAAAAVADEPDRALRRLLTAAAEASV